MALFRRKKDDAQDTAESAAVERDTDETEAVAAGDDGASQPTAVHSTVEAPGGGSFIPESDTETTKAVEETGERAEERQEAAKAPEPEPVAAKADDKDKDKDEGDKAESPRDAHRRAKGLPESEVPGGRASAVRQSPPTSQPPPAPSSVPRESPLGAQVAAEEGDGMKPEIAVGAAFLGGLVFAQLLKWLGSDEDE